jgi:DNA gyrase subunit B
MALWRALSARLRLDVYRDGQHYRQEFRIGEPLAEATHVGPTRRTGLQLHAYPDQTIFSDLHVLSSNHLAERLQILAALHPGVRIAIHDERVFDYEIHFPAGLTDYVRTRIGIWEAAALELHGQHEDVAVSLVWQLRTGGGSAHVESFVNGEPSEEHGSHVDGFWRGVRLGLKDYCKSHGLGQPVLKRLRPKELDIPGHLVLAVSLQLPRYGSATRAILRDPRALEAVETLVRRWLPNQLGTPGSGKLLEAWLMGRER